MGKIVNVSLLALVAMLSVHGALSCDDGWIGMGDSCYKTSPDPVNWFQAEEVPIYVPRSNFKLCLCMILITIYCSVLQITRKLSY